MATLGKVDDRLVVDNEAPLGDACSTTAHRARRRSAAARRKSRTAPAPGAAPTGGEAGKLGVLPSSSAGHRPRRRARRRSICRARSGPDIRSSRLPGRRQHGKHGLAQPHAVVARDRAIYPHSGLPPRLRGRCRQLRASRAVPPLRACSRSDEISSMPISNRSRRSDADQAAGRNAPTHSAQSAAMAASNERRVGQARQRMIEGEADWPPPLGVTVADGNGAPDGTAAWTR